MLLPACLLAACGTRSALLDAAAGAGGSTTSSSTGGEGGTTSTTGTTGTTSTTSTTTGTTTSTSTTSTTGTTTTTSTTSTTSTSTTSTTTCFPEVCDGVDNDCNGIVDDGCAPGCSDGTREGFLDAALYPKIAACSGGWSVPGILFSATALCGRIAGNSSSNPSGTGCSPTDLCAVGFHVCKTSAEVKERSPTGCSGAAPSAGLFFATRQSSNGCNACALGTNPDADVCNGETCAAGCAPSALTANNLYGCGSMGSVVSSCEALDRASGDECSELGAPWSCPGSFTEAQTVVKPDVAGGGVLCCAD